MRRPLLVLAFVVLSICATGCDELRGKWVDAANECGIGDAIPATMLYFGPSSNAGPGSGWQETFDRKRRHVDYRLRIDTEQLPDPKAFMRPSPSGYECKGGRDVTLNLDTGVAARASTFPLSAELSGDLQWARNIRVTIGGLGWDELDESGYEEYVRKNLGPGNRYYEELNGPDRLVLRRALAVKNLIIVYSFAKEDAAWLKSKYTGPLGGQGSGEIGGGFSAEWHDNNDLMITSPSRAWIFGELVPFKSRTGFAASQEGRRAVKLVRSSAIVADNENRLAPPRRPKAAQK